MLEILINLWGDLLPAFGETFLMVGVSSFFAIAGGLPLGFLLHITERRLFWENQTAQVIGSFVVNIIRSLPFVILLVLLLPFTQWAIGTTIGPTAAKVTPIITGRRMPNHCVAPQNWISVTRPQQKRSAEISIATCSGVRCRARPTISGTAMAPAYMTSTCCRPRTAS